LNFGVFQNYYSITPPFSSSKSITIIGVLASSLPTLGVPFVTPIALRYPYYQRHLVVGGWMTCVLALLLASFATQVWQLILTQGLMYGTGWAVCYTPFFIMANEWFIAKRGVVFGIVFAASGVSGLVLPFILETCLDSYGSRATLRGAAVAVFLFVGPGPVFLIKPRIPRRRGGPSRATTANSLGNVRFLRDPRFYVFAVAIFLQGIGLYLPNIFLPSFARLLDLSHAQGAALLALLSAAQVAGQIALGWMSDVVDVHIPAALSALIPALAALLLWGLAKSFAPLAIFALLFSFFGAANSVFWSRICAMLADDPASAMMLYGLFNLERGVGGALSGPLSTWLMVDEVDRNSYGLERYGRLVAFVGVTMAASSLCGLGWFVRGNRFYARKAEAVVSDEAAALRLGHSTEDLRGDDVLEMERLYVRPDPKAEDLR